MDLYSNMEEDFIVVTPSEAGEPPLEYCAQDESRCIDIQFTRNFVIRKHCGVSKQAKYIYVSLFIVAQYTYFQA